MCGRWRLPVNGVGLLRSLDRSTVVKIALLFNQPGQGEDSDKQLQGGSKACYDHNDDDDDQEEVYVNKSDEVDKWIIEDDRQVQRDSVVVVFGSGRQRRKFRVFGR